MGTEEAERALKRIYQIIQNDTERREDIIIL
jgi:hypothetical protein